MVLEFSVHGTRKHPTSSENLVSRRNCSPAMEEPLSQRPEHQAPTAEEIQRRRNRFEIPYQLQAAELICVDSDLRIFQRFNELRVFVILRLQHRLAGMTEELDKLKKARNDTDGDICSDSTLESLTKDIEYTLRDYGTRLSRYIPDIRLTMWSRRCNTGAKKG
jgi:hypothetical protein